jgi:SAM-dependent methyltransferase
MPDPKPSEPPWADPAYLRDVQYADDRNLAARQSIYAYSECAVDLPCEVIASLNLAGNEIVIDVGCGNGSYLAELAKRGHAGRVAGVDLSPGMLKRSGTRAPRAGLLVGDAARLPLGDVASDVTLAMHMLYHVAEPAAAVAELHRVTRPGGMVVIGLNGDDHLAELRALVNEELSTSGLSGGHVVQERIRLDDAEEMLARAFGAVTRHDLTGRLRLPNPRPVADYVLSMGLAQRPADQQRLAEAVTGRLDFGASGVFTVTTHCGWLICT